MTPEEIIEELKQKCSRMSLILGMTTGMLYTMQEHLRVAGEDMGHYEPMMKRLEDAINELFYKNRQ